jgi:hypothetical protein
MTYVDLYTDFRAYDKCPTELDSYKTIRSATAK